VEDKGHVHIRDGGFATPAYYVQPAYQPESGQNDQENDQEMIKKTIKK
jgi:hypothetical protein